VIDGFKLTDLHWDEGQDTQWGNSKAPSRPPVPNDRRLPGAKSSPKGLAMLLGDASDAPMPQHPRLGGAPERRGELWRLAIVATLAVGAVCWGGWMTKALLDVEKREGRFVKMELQGVITEYLQAQARSGSDERSAAEATTAFMAELDKAVAALGDSGKVVLVNEAVIGGNIPDVTAAVKKSVYAHVPMPRVADDAVRQDMRVDLATGGEGADGGAGGNAP